MTELTQLADDPLALQQFIALHGARIFSQALRIVKNPEDAEEVMQDVLLKIVQGAANFKGECALSSWIHRITYTTACTHYRKTHAARRGAGVTPLGEEALEAVTDASVMPQDATLVQRELYAAVHEALAELPEVYRETARLRYIEELSVPTIGKELGVNEQTIKSRLLRSRNLLRDKLQGVA